MRARSVRAASRAWAARSRCGSRWPAGSEVQSPRTGEDPRMDRVRLAIVGCGNISQLNAPGYLGHPRCDVVALCDTDPERTKRRAREWGITPRLYSDFAQVLDDPAIDAVELLTPTWMHAEQIVAALGADKHVSAQKPLAVSVAE